MRVEILQFDDCPNVGPTIERVKRVAASLGVEIDLHLVLVATHDDALRERFLGSPSVRVDGVDIDPSAAGRSDFGLSCRVYGREGSPPEAMIAAGITGKPFDPVQSKGQGLATSGALLAAILSSACCWLPLVLVALGVSAGGVALAFEPLRPWFIGIAVMLLGFGIWWTERGVRRAHACGCPMSRRRVALNRGMLGLSVLGMAAFIFFPQYAGNVFGQRAAVRARDTQLVTFHVEGMTCTGCEAGIEAALLKLPGVTRADASYEREAVTVGFESGAVSTAALIGAVAQAGYAATGPEAIRSKSGLNGAP
jgi:copper chaperone CopZ